MSDPRDDAPAGELPEPEDGATIDESQTTPPVDDASPVSQPAPPGRSADSEVTQLDTVAPDTSESANGSSAEPPQQAAPTTDATLVDPALAADDSDQTINDPDRGAIRNTIESAPADPSATQLDTVNTPEGDPNQTALDANRLDSDATQIEAPSAVTARLDGSQTIAEDGFDPSQGHGTAAGGGDPSSTETRVDDNLSGSVHSTTSGGSPRLHETADRWQDHRRYQLVSNFARGGLGSIWMAQDSRLRREVAYKELLPAALKNRSSLERFLEEAQITGQLEHPGIVPVYDIGYQSNGTPFYAMKLVRGETFDRAIDTYHKLPADSPDRALVFRRLLKSFIDICNAIAFAHDRGVLHRDLKPLNVMLGAFGETLVLDWGLAKVFDTELSEDDAPVTTSTDGLETGGETMAETQAGPHSQAGSTHAGGASIGGHTGTLGSTRRMVITDVRSAGSETMAGSVMGTPAYMPPEQARGELEQMDARSDIYSLGGILYRLLTNRPPIAKDKKVSNVLRNVIEGNIVPPRQHVPATPRPLEAICLAALANRKEDRYDSALHLAADVEAWLADEPVSVFEDPLPVRARRWAKRHPRTVSASVAAVLVVALTYGGNALARNQQLQQARSAGRASIVKAERLATDSEFQSAKDELIAAIGRTGDDPDLEDLRRSLSTQQDLIESQRLQVLKTRVETRLEDALVHIDHDDMQEARTELANLNTLLKNEASLSSLKSTVANHLDFVQKQLANEQAISQTSDRFHAFIESLDDVRRYAALFDRADHDDDANMAMRHAKQALDIFDLNTNDAFEPPEHFDRNLTWTKDWHDQHGSWPDDALRQSAYELFITLATQQSKLARNGTDEQLQAAADASLEWLTKAEALGIRTQALLGWKSEFQRVAGHNVESEQTLQAAQKLIPSTALDYFLLADADRQRALYDSSRYELAITGYLQAQQRDPDNFWVHQYLGLCYLQLDQPAAALPCYSNCISRRPNDAWSFMMRGVCFGLLGQAENSMRDFSRAIELDPNQAKSFINRGAILQRLGQIDEALADFATAAKLEPESARPHLATATTHFQKATAIRDGRQGFAELSDLKRAELEQREYDKALDALAKIADDGTDRRYPELHQLRGRVYERQQNIPSAIASFQRHLQLEPDPTLRAVSQKQIGFIELGRGEFQSAQSAFENADSLASDDPETVFHLAEALLQSGQDAAALKRYNQFARLFKLDIKTELLRPEILFNGMALAHESLGHRQQAIDYYTLALMFNRVQPVPLTRRGWVYIQHAKELARRDFEEAVRQNPDNPDTRIGLAFTLARQGEWKPAVEQIDEATPNINAQATQLGARGFPLYFNAATALAQCLPAVESDSTITDTIRSQARDALQTRTVTMLSNAYALARRDAEFVLPAFVQALETDRTLDPIRAATGFKQLLSQARSGQIE